MEKQFKPVPDVECLKYHGTPEKPDIKIFVSHRIDQDSETIDNPLYIPVRCGAVYDDREGITMLGDDTGDNISEKRMSYCELTVQYWAWKNVKADYYGLCHYRRYIGFAGKKYETGIEEANNGCVVEQCLDQTRVAKHCLNEEEMRKVIEDYDIIAIDPIKIDITNYGAMKGSPDYHNMDDVDLAMDIIKRKYPQMITAVDSYMHHSPNCWLYNCWVMKADIFDEYSRWLFEILTEIEANVDNSYYSQQMYRTPGTLGERLWGIYLTYLIEQGKRRIKRQQLVFFKNAKKERKVIPFTKENNVVIASNFNNNYVSCFSVLLQSIIENASPCYNYDIIILSQDITPYNEKTLEEMVQEQENFSLRIVDVTNYLQPIDMYVGNAVYTEDMYTRVLVSHILSEYNRVLVLDADMVCERDVADLFFVNLGDKWAGAVKDTVYQGYLNGMVPDAKRYAEKVLKLSNPYNYCNTGVILFNCEKIRQEFSLEYLQNYIHTHKYRIYEQDTLNVLLDKRILFLSQDWNMYSYTNPFVEQCISVAPLEAKNAYLKARKCPSIIHYAAHPKPWWTGDGDFAVRFWLRARKSPFYEELLAGMVRHIAEKSGGTPVVMTEQYISNARKFADIILPKGTRRREFAKRILPKGSRRWNFCKKIYFKLGGK